MAKEFHPTEIDCLESYITELETINKDLVESSKQSLFRDVEKMAEMSSLLIEAKDIICPETFCCLHKKINKVLGYEI